MSAGSDEGDAASPGAAPADEVDRSWKVLLLTIDWLKHAETKAAVTLAASGVVGGVLYRIISDESDPSDVVAGSAIVSAIALVVAGLTAGWSVRPRLRPKEEPSSPLYFDHIARKHLGAAEGRAYAAALTGLVRDNERLLGEIGEQIWINARIARQKYQLTGWAVIFLLVSLVALSIVVVGTV